MQALRLKLLEQASHVVTLRAINTSSIYMQALKLKPLEQASHVVTLRAVG